MPLATGRTQMPDTVTQASTTKSWYGDDQDWGGNSSFGPGGGELPTAPGASQTNPPAVTPR